MELCRKVHALLALVIEREEALDAGDLALAVLQRSAECYPKVPIDLEVRACVRVCVCVCVCVRACAFVCAWGCGRLHRWG